MSEPLPPISLTILLDNATSERFRQALHEIVRSAFNPDSHVPPHVRAARSAHFRGQTPPDDQGLLTAKETAKLLKLSERTVFSMRHGGKMPPPLHFGNAIRWRRNELIAWLDAGCPSQDDWVWPQPIH